MENIVHNNIYEMGGICPCRKYHTECRYRHRVQQEDWIRREIVDFIRKNPYPDLRQRVDLARELGLSREELDNKVYQLLTEFIVREY